MAELPEFKWWQDVPSALGGGLYFAYEEGEVSEHGPSGRIVRIGQGGKLRGRLRDHYAGNKNGSALRKLIGGALLLRADPQHPCLQPEPGRKRGHWRHSKGKTCDVCRPVEAQVSALLCGRFRFRVVQVPNAERRETMEEALIRELAGCPVCRPSAHWLGLDTYSPEVQICGLWNSDGTESAPSMDEALLSTFEGLVATTCAKLGGR